MLFVFVFVFFFLLADWLVVVLLKAGQRGVWQKRRQLNEVVYFHLRKVSRATVILFRAFRNVFAGGVYASSLEGSLCRLSAVSYCCVERVVCIVDSPPS